MRHPARHPSRHPTSRAAILALVLAGSLLPTATAAAFTVDPATVWINEIHYDNAATDVGEGDRDRRTGRDGSLGLDRPALQRGRWRRLSQSGL